MKHEWRKKEKLFYLPKTKPELIDIPSFNYFAIKGKGNPNDDFFAEYIGVLYSVSYAVKMSPKSGFNIKDYFDYTVYPLEGVWDISEEEKQKGNKQLNKDELIFNLMIRQPGFVSKEVAEEIIERTKKKKPHKLLDEIEFVNICDGKSVQMMHLGSYDDEPASFKMMEDFCDNNGLFRESKQHREIYLSDARKVEAAKLKTVLRFKVRPE